MKPWWERWKGRLEAELAAFQSAGLSFRRDDVEFARGRVILRGRAPVADGEVADLVIVYPDTFPFTRFAVFAPGLDLGRHQNPFERNLCVFPRNSSYWRPRTLAATVVAEEVPKLVRLTRTGGEALREAEVPQGEPITDFYEYTPGGGVLLPGNALEVPRTVFGGRLLLRMRDSAAWLFGRDGRPVITGQALLFEVADPRGRVVAKAEEVLSAGFGGTTFGGLWVRAAKAPQGRTCAEFLKLLVEEHPEIAREDKEPKNCPEGIEFLGVVFREEVRQGVKGDAWVFPALPRGWRGRRSGKGGVLVRGLRAGVTDLAERIPELASLREKTVALVGLGTLGSPVAYEFARGLLGKLRLLDYDHVEAGTVVRWAGGLDAAGPAKTLGLASRLRSAYPYTTTECVNLAVGSAGVAHPEVSEAETLEQWLEGAHLMVNASAEDNVGYAVSDLAWAHGIPQVHVWGIEGVGGLVARLVPGRTGCYHCLLRATSRDGGFIRTPDPPPESEQQRVQPRGCSDPTFAAANVDLLPLAVEAARTAFGVLCAGTVGGYPSLREDVLVLTLRNPDKTLVGPPRWESHLLPPYPDCPLCTVRR